VIRWERLRLPDGTPLEVELESADPNAPLPMAVPLAFAEEEQEGDALLWRDGETDRVGLFQVRSRASWNRAEIRGLHVAVLKPGDGPGVVGLELILVHGEEVPILAASPYSEPVRKWFLDRSGLWSAYFGCTPVTRDYGVDR